MRIAEKKLVIVSRSGAIGAAPKLAAANRGSYGRPQARAAADARKLGLRRSARSHAPQRLRRTTRYSRICWRGVAIERPNQVWCTDITCLPIARGFLYLVAIMDWASRAVLSLADVEHDGRFHSACPRSRKRSWLLPAGDLQHRPGLPVHWRRLPACASRWTAASAGWTTFSSSGGCGARSSTRMSISKAMMTAPRRTAVLPRGLRFHNNSRPQRALGSRTPIAALARRDQRWIA